MKISYAITVCNENEIIHLINYLNKYKKFEDEICVLLDKPKVTPYLLDQLYRFSSNDVITLKESSFNNNFADWKNELNRMCVGDYIFNIDADESPSSTLMENIHEVLKLNPNIRAFALPRINTVANIGLSHIQKWKWNINEKGWINYPDYQIRIYKNSLDILWEGKVHETLNIKNEVVPLPSDTEDWVLYHPKDIERQEQQNNLYNNL